jgi:cob(I)alamin adenosyltransferase
MKIYTRTGDAGSTGLIGGKRVSKSALRIEAYGDVDEASACIGAALAFIGDAALRRRLERVQHDLFRAGCRLATPPERGYARLPSVTAAHVRRLERDIDTMESRLPPLREFILPGGSKGGAFLHMARAVARRAERRVVELSETESIPPALVIYLNRLSDFLFVAARAANRAAGAGEIPWKK